MSGTVEYQVDGYRDDRIVTDEYKINYLARVLADYDDETWKRLAFNRKSTYRRAAASLLHGFDSIAKLMDEWG